jgi:hypothetical protein
VKESEALLGQISEITNCVKNQRFDLALKMFQQIPHLTGRDFTKFVSSKGVLHSSDPHSLDQMSFHDLAGHHFWLNAVGSELRSCLMHYRDCKRRASSTTSACILVPKHKHGAAGSMLHKWSVVMELPTGQMLHVWKDGKLHLEKSRYAMQVLYDPVGSEQLHHVYQDGRVTMQFVG